MVLQFWPKQASIVVVKYTFRKRLQISGFVRWPLPHQFSPTSPYLASQKTLIRRRRDCFPDTSEYTAGHSSSGWFRWKARKTGNMKIKTILIATTILASATVTANSHMGATGIVKERMDAMASMGKAVKKLSAMMRGESKYNAAIVREGAEIIASHSGTELTRLFEKGGNAKPSVARDEIWTDWDEFKNMAVRLAILSNGLKSAAQNGLKQTKDTAKSMMGTGTSSMMVASQTGMMAGNNMMMGNAALPSSAMLANMPADGVFNMVTQTCSSCHTKFRLEKK
jgi:cytochrome c556